jgi:hypothetical protein
LLFHRPGDDVEVKNVTSLPGDSKKRIRDLLAVISPITMKVFSESIYRTDELHTARKGIPQ